MREVKAPFPLHDVHGDTIFLAGSIEMGAAERWQDYVAAHLRGAFTILNPRRDNWDPSWPQDINHPQFREQVEWELDAMERADFIIMYFDPATKSPITLLELGLYAKSEKLMVICPEGFWRKGNVDIVCNRYRVKRVVSLDRAIAIINGSLSFG